jgi:hypothetical protein
VCDEAFGFSLCFESLKFNTMASYRIFSHPWHPAVRSLQFTRYLPQPWLMMHPHTPGPISTATVLGALRGSVRWAWDHFRQTNNKHWSAQ